MLNILQQNANWRYFFAENDLNWIEIKYEDLCKDPSATVQKVCSHIAPNLKLFPNVNLNNLRFKIQRNHINQEWRERFLQELGDWSFNSFINS